MSVSKSHRSHQWALAGGLFLVWSCHATAMDAIDSAISQESDNATSAEYGAPPLSADARINAFTAGAIVNAVTRISIFRPSEDSSEAVEVASGEAEEAGRKRRSDEVTVQLRVRAMTNPETPMKTGDWIDGPQRTIRVTNTRSHYIRVNLRTGEVRIRLPLTSKQAKAIRAWRTSGLNHEEAADKIRVVVTHAKDTRSDRDGYEVLHKVAAAVRYRGDPLSPPATLTTEGTTGVVTVTNSTPNPLLLMSGPVQCMYDSLYGGSTLNHPTSHLGTLNGQTLQVGQTISVTVQNDHNISDGADDNNAQDVLDDYTDAQDTQYQSVMQTNPLGVPHLQSDPSDPSSVDSEDLEIFKQLAEFTYHAANDIVGTEGMAIHWSALAKKLLQSTGVAYEDVDLGPAWGLFGLTSAGYGDLLGPLMAIASGVYTIITESCASGNKDYFILGGTDVNEPWRQFQQLYYWNYGNPVPSNPNDVENVPWGYVSFANGMLLNAGKWSEGIQVTEEMWNSYQLAGDRLDLYQRPYIPASGKSLFEFIQPDADARTAILPQVSYWVDSGSTWVICDTRAWDETVYFEQVYPWTQFAQNAPKNVYFDFSGAPAGNIDSTGAWQAYEPNYTDYTDGIDGANLRISDPVKAADYLVAFNYVPGIFNGGGGPVPTVIPAWSDDGYTWETPDPTDNQWSSNTYTQYNIPAKLPKYLTCVAQAPELFRDVLPLYRTVLSGTRIPGNVIPGPGPDYYQDGAMAQ